MTKSVDTTSETPFSLHLSDLMICEAQDALHRTCGRLLDRRRDVFHGRRPHVTKAQAACISVTSPVDR